MVIAPMARKHIVEAAVFREWDWPKVWAIRQTAVTTGLRLCSILFGGLGESGLKTELDRSMRQRGTFDADSPAGLVDKHCS
jgi:hypothetical protein